MRGWRLNLLLSLAQSRHHHVDTSAVDSNVVLRSVLFLFECTSEIHFPDSICDNKAKKNQREKVPFNSGHTDFSDYNYMRINADSLSPFNKFSSPKF